MKRMRSLKWRQWKEKTQKKKAHVEEDDEEESPIEKVRLTVSNTDDPTQPVWAFRTFLDRLAHHRPPHGGVPPHHHFPDPRLQLEALLPQHEPLQHEGARPRHHIRQCR